MVHIPVPGEKLEPRIYNPKELPSNASSKDVARGAEVCKGSASHTVVVGDARSQTATKALRVELCSTRHTEVAGDATSSDASKVLKGRRNSALHMEGAADAATMDAERPPGTNQGYAFVTEEVKGVSEKGAQGVPRVYLRVMHLSW